MPYLQLSQLPLPTSAARTTVFPFLLEDGPAGTATYRLSLLVCDRNRLAQAFLRTLGFNSVNGATPTTSIPLPGGDAADTWTFFFADDAGPIPELEEQLPATDPKSLAHYLTFGAPTEIVPGVIRPASVTVNESVLDQGQLRTTASFGLESIRLTPPVTNWHLAFAATSGSTDQTAVSFEFPISGSLPETTNPDYAFSLQAKLVPIADTAGVWGGATLKVNDFDLEGGPDDRFLLDGFALVTHTTGSAPNVELSLEWEPRVALDIPLLKSSVFKVGFGIQALRVTYGPRDVVVSVLGGSTGSPIRLRLDLEFPLIMAPLTNAAPEALAVIIPLLDQVKERPPKLSWTLTFTVDSPWTSPLVRYTKDNHWEIGKFNESWQFEFLDRSKGMDFGGMHFSVADLVGDALGAVGFGLRPDCVFSQSKLGGSPQLLKPAFELKGDIPVVTVPMEFDVSVGPYRVSFGLKLSINLKTLRLFETNRVELYLPNSPEGVPLQVIDLGALAILLPYRNPESQQPDGFIDFEKREFVLVAHGDSQPLWVVVPGLLGLEGAGDDEAPPKDEFHKRLIFELNPQFDPDHYVPGKNEFRAQPPNPANECYLRINGNGLSFHAKVVQSHAVTVFAGDQLSPKVDVRPQKERNQRNSHIVLVDNAIREAAIFGEMDVPGTDDLVAAVEIGLRQKQRGQPPVVYATVDLNTTDGKPLAQLTAGYLQISIDDFHDWTLSWDTGTHDWKLSLPTDLRISVAPRTSSVGGLEQLRDKDAIKVRDLDLMNLHRGAGSVELALDRDVEFDCLDGMFGVRLNQLKFGWGHTFVFECETAEFTFKNPGAFDVTIEVGGVHLEFSGGSKLKMRNPSRIGIDATIGDAVRFRGAVAWVDNDRERYFAAAGTLTIEGLPEATTLLKIGTGVKDNGQVVPNIVLYGAADYEITLFAGVVAKNFGAGIGINNRLKGIGEHPNAEEVLANIDSIDPSRIEGWDFVRRNGFYLSIVGTTIIASNEGGNSTDNAYVAALVLSIDLDLNVIAAGKLWLYSSVDFVRRRENWRRPALVGAITLIPRERLITAAFESKPNPAVESNDRIAEILNKGHIKLSFLMSPKLVDFFLQDVSYRDQFLGVEMAYQGSLRFAIYRGTVLLRASQMITGHFNRELSEGPGGFSADGDLAVYVEFGGLVSGRGLAAYGLISIAISLRIRAWIKIEFSFTIGAGRWKKRISFSKTFNLQDTRLELGLRGAIAFNESGQFGFDGQLSISISICGYRLSIAPSLRFNDGVITEVRGRVAAFEERIEAARQELLGGSGAGRSLSAAATASTLSEQWLLYQSNGWVFLVPQAGRDWFTPHVTFLSVNDPPQFAGDVRSIQIYRDQGAGPVLVLTLLTPWDEANQRQLEPDVKTKLATQLEELETIMAETAVNGSAAGPDITPHGAFRPVADPRFKSTGREFWTDEDRVRLPDYALPVQLRSVEDVLSAGAEITASESDFGQLVDYLFWRQRAVRVQRHRGNDRDEAEQLFHNRGAVGQMLLDDLGQLGANPDAATSSNSPWIARPVTGAPPSPTRVGIVFRFADGFDVSQLADFSQLSFKVVRDGTAGEIPIQVTCPTLQAEIDATRKLVEPAPARQQFVVDNAGDATTAAGEQARVIVKLPISISPEFLQQRIETVSHFRVFRRFPWQDLPELVGDQLRPDLVYIDRNDDVAASDQPVVVVGPFLFTDEFRVTDRRLTSPGLVGDVTQIEYRLQVVPVGDASTPTATASNSTPWAPVRLHIPLPDVFPTDLGIVLPVESIISRVDNNPDFGGFALISTGVEGMPLASMPAGNGLRRLIQASDLEIWAEPIPLAASGFYAGAVEGASESGGDSATSTVNQLPTTDRSIRARTTDGLLKLAIKEDPQDAGWFRAVPSAAFPRSGFGYRFYVRPMAPAASNNRATPQAFGAVFPLDAFLARERPAVVVAGPANLLNWKEHPRLRPIRQVEFIDADEIIAIRDQSWHWTPLVVCERQLDRYVLQHVAQQTKRQLGLEWIMEGRDQGGVEIMLRDGDDTGLQSRILCETLAESEFQRRIPDFRNASLWQLTRLEQSSRLNWKYEPHPLSAIPANAEIPRQFLYRDISNPLLGQLNRRKTELEQVLGTSNSTWVDVFNAAKNWLTAIYEFQKSPINLNDSAIRLAITRIKTLLRYGLTGRTDTALSSLNDATIKRIDDEGYSLLREVEEADPARLQLEDATEEQRLAATRTLVDLDLAKRLAAIIRRREVIAEELFDSSTSAPPSGVDGTFNLDDPRWLPRGDRFEELRNRQAAQTVTLAGTLPRSARLLALFGKAPTILLPRQDPSDPLRAANKNLLDLAEFSLPDPERERLGAGIVANAAGMTLALNCVKQALSTFQGNLIRRPHHQVSVARSENASRTPQSTKLEALLPDEVRNQLELTAVSVSPFQEVIAYLSFLERLGFALDIAATDSLGDLLSQKELITLLRQADLMNCMKSKPRDMHDHLIQIVVGREPDSELHGVFPDPDGAADNHPYVGHSFVKLIVIPKTFHDLLTSELHVRVTDDAPTAAQKAANRKQLHEEWLGIRSIDAGTDEGRWVAWLERLGRVANYLIHERPADAVTTIRVEVRDRRWVSVPAVNDRSHIDWATPDTRGHRLEAVGRKVSRYEPVIRWALGDFRLSRWPAAVEIEPESLEIRRLVTRDVKQGFVADVSENLPVSLYPNPELIQFGYLLPSAGARSILNVISSVRTGYQGVSTVFRYDLRDHDQAERQWLKFMSAVVHQPPVTGDSTSLIPDPPTLIKPAPQMVLSDVRLFRHERLVTLRDLPHFYEYRLHVRSHYDADYLFPIETQFPDGDHAARREPKILAWRPAKMEPPDINEQDPEATVSIELRLTRTGDLLTPDEWASSPPLEQRPFTVLNGAGGTSSISLSGDQLPEPSASYHLYYLANKPDNGSGSPSSNYYVSIAEVLMPWHPAYKPREPQHSGDPPLPLNPWFRLLDSRVSYVAATDEWPSIIVGQSEHGSDTHFDAPAYMIRLQFKVQKANGDPELLFAAGNRRFLQVSRCGKLSEPIAQEV